MTPTSRSLKSLPNGTSFPIGPAPILSDAPSRINFPQLLDMLAIKGCIVTIDAMGCQTAIAEKIIEKGGDYVLAVKENQPSLNEGVRLVFKEMPRELQSLSFPKI